MIFEPVLKLFFMRTCLNCCNQTSATYVLFCKECQNQILQNINFQEDEQGNIILFDRIDPIKKLIKNTKQNNYYAEHLTLSFFLSVIYSNQREMNTIYPFDNPHKNENLRLSKKISSILSPSDPIDLPLYIALEVKESALQTFSHSIVALTWS